MSEDSRKVSKNRLATWGVRQARHSRSVSTSWRLSKVSASGGGIANTQITKTVHNKMLHSDDLTVHYIYIPLGEDLERAEHFSSSFFRRG